MITYDLLTAVHMCCRATVCSGTGIVILWNCDCGTEIQDLFLKLHLQILQGEVEQLQGSVIIRAW